MAVDHDQLFKQLLRIFTIEFIWLFLPEVAEYIDPSSITLIETEMFTDLVTGKAIRPEEQKYLDESGQPLGFSNAPAVPDEALLGKK